MENDAMQQGSEAWKNLRKDKIGASDAAAIMGVSPWTTPHTLWTYKMGLAEPEMNSAMQRGVEMEEAARSAFNSVYETDTKAAVYIDDVYPWLMASLDGVSSDKKTVVEIKCCGQKDHDIAVSGNVPEKYWPQLQHQLYVTGLKEMWYFSYRSSFDYKALQIKRNDDYISKLIEAEKEFYRRMIEFDPPPLCDRDYFDMQKADLSKAVMWETYSRMYIESTKERKKWEEQEETFRKNLIALSDGKNCKGNGIKLTKYARKGAVQYAKIPELEKVDLEQYRGKTIESYRISEVQDGDTT